LPRPKYKERSRDLEAQVASMRQELSYLRELHSTQAHSATEQRLVAEIRQTNFNYTELTKQLGGGDNAGFLSAFPYDEIIRKAHALSYNPFAQRILQIPRDLLMRWEYPFKSKDKTEETRLKAYWEDPQNNFPEWRKQILVDFGFYGEQIFTTFTNPVSKIVRHGEIIPYAVDTIIGDPDNDRVPIGIKLKSGTQTEEILTTIIEPVQQPVFGEKNRAWHEAEERHFSPETRALRDSFTIADPRTGKRIKRYVFLFQIHPKIVSCDKKWGTNRRGTSDLETLIDWILATDDCLSSILERADLLSRTLWQLKVNGGNMNPGDPMNLDTIREKYASPPNKYEVKVTNEHMTWTREDGTMANSDMIQLFQEIQQYCVGGSGYPSHWFVGGRNSNRASADAEETPALAKLETRQDTFLGMFKKLFKFQLVQFGDQDHQFEMIRTKLKKRDLVMFASAFLKFTDSLLTGKTEGWVSPIEAAQIYRQFLQKEYEIVLDAVDLSHLELSDNPPALPDEPSGDVNGMRNESSFGNQEKDKPDVIDSDNKE